MIEPELLEAVGKIAGVIAVAVFTGWSKIESSRAKRRADAAHEQADEAKLKAESAKQKIDRADTDMDEIGFRNGDRGLDWFRQMRATQNLALDLKRRVRQSEDAIMALFKPEQDRTSADVEAIHQALKNREEKS